MVAASALLLLPSFLVLPSWMAKVICKPEHMAAVNHDVVGQIMPSFTFCQAADCIQLHPTTKLYGPTVE